MNHIVRLTAERDELRELIKDVRAELTETIRYLTSDKFAPPDADYVHVRTDILPKLTRIQFMTCGH